MLRLKLPQSDDEYPINQVSFEKEDDGNYFILKSTEEQNINIIVPYDLTVYETYATNKFDCYAFLSPIYYKEQDIFEVKVNDKKIGRIGWIFPIQTLSSKDHSFAENEHFLRYAFVAFRKLLLGEYLDYDFTFETLEPSTQIDITDIYKSELIVLCCSKDQTDKIIDFDLHNYIPFLYSSRYISCSHPQELDSLKKEIGDGEAPSLVIKEISILLRNEIFITSLFNDLLKKAGHPLVKFHLLYQVIEILINKIYDTEINHIMLVSQSRKKNPYEILGDINKLQTEEYRVTKLIDAYLKNIPPSGTQLILVCNQVLQLIEQDPISHIGKAFYKVRNAVVHNFRHISVKDTNDTVFPQFVTFFEKFIIETLINYNDESAEYSLYPLEWLNYQLQKGK